MVPRMNGRQRSGNFDQAFGQQRVPDIDRLSRLAHSTAYVQAGSVAGRPSLRDQRHQQGG